MQKNRLIADLKHKIHLLEEINKEIRLDNEGLKRVLLKVRTDMDAVREQVEGHKQLQLILTSYLVLLVHKQGKAVKIRPQEVADSMGKYDLKVDYDEEEEAWILRPVEIK